jgi:hypothetical protein
MKVSKKVAAGLAAGAVALAGAGVAYSYWSAGGTGSGSASVGAGTDDLSASSTADSAVVPGGTADLDLTVSNGSTTTSEHFASISYTISNDNEWDATNNPTGCKSSDFSITGLPTDVTVAPSGSVEYNAANTNAPVLSMTDDTANSQDGCKNANLDIEYTVNAS